MHKVGELFAGKNIKNDVALLFEDVELDRMAVNEKAGILKLYIKDTRLIVKQEIRELERELSRKLQIKGVSKIQVVEKYTLPGVYTPKKWFENYSDSISLELMENVSIRCTMRASFRLRMTRPSSYHCPIISSLETGRMTCAM